MVSEASEKKEELKENITPETETATDIEMETNNKEINNTESNNNNNIVAATTEEPSSKIELLEYLLEFIETENELNYVLAGYFSKFFITLLNRNATAVNLTYIK